MEYIYIIAMHCIWRAEVIFVSVIPKLWSCISLGTELICIIFAPIKRRFISSRKAVATHGEATLSGISFQLKGDVRADGNIHLRETNSYAADIIRTPTYLVGIDADNILSFIMQHYNVKLAGAEEDDG